jgi:pyruvate-formate lyase-activating enzyme
MRKMKTMEINNKIKSNQTYHEITVNDEWLKFRGERYMEYRRLWTELPAVQKVPDFPLHLDIETTTMCNLSCTMCGRTRMIGRGELSGREKMEFDEFMDIIDQAAKGGVYSIKLNYLGEPLVHPDVVRQVRYAKEHGIVDVMFNTNGMLLNRKMSSELLEAGLDKLFLSFDSPYPEAYERIRVGANFEKVMENLRYFYSLKREKYPHVQVRVSMVMMDDASGVIEDYVKLFSGTVDAIGFDECRDIGDISVKPVIEGFSCAQLFQRMFLRCGGDVIVCCGDHMSRYAAGNWKKEKLKNIWQGECYTRIRTAHMRGRYHLIPICGICTVPAAQESALKRKSLVGSED